MICLRPWIGLMRLMRCTLLASWTFVSAQMAARGTAGSLQVRRPRYRTDPCPWLELGESSFLRLEYWTDTGSGYIKFQHSRAIRSWVIGNWTYFRPRFSGGEGEFWSPQLKKLESDLNKFRESWLSKVTSHQTHYKSYRYVFYGSNDPTNSVKALKV